MGGSYAGGSKYAGERRKKKLKSPGIYELLGVALGCIGLTYKDFCKLEYEEFEAVYKAYAEQRDASFKTGWEQIRMLATITIQPHLGRRSKITPEKLLPFPWDKLRAPKAATLTKEEHRARMEELAKRFGDKLI